MPPGFTNSLTASVVDWNSEDEINGWTDLRYLAAVSSRVGTGSLGRESSNRSIRPFEVSSLYPEMPVSYCSCGVIDSGNTPAGRELLLRAFLGLIATLCRALLARRIVPRELRDVLLVVLRVGSCS
jgi:hypothetical protein